MTASDSKPTWATTRVPAHYWTRLAAVVKYVEAAHRVGQYAAEMDRHAGWTSGWMIKAFSDLEHELEAARADLRKALE